MPTWINPHPFAWLVLLPVYFVVLWCVVLAAVSRVGGWAVLARQYRFPSEFVGERWRRQTGQMRWMANYGNCLTLGGNATGLYLSIMPLFRFQHPPLLIPWAEISVSRQRRFFFFNYVRLTLGREAGIPLWLRPKIAEKLKRAGGSRWPVEEVR